MMTIEQTRRDLYPAFKQALDNIDQCQGVESLSHPYLDELLESYRKGISRRQVVISFTKWMHGFNVTNPVLDSVYLLKEVSEALEAFQIKTPKDAVEELADVAIYCYGIAQMFGLDLDKSIEEKMAYNRERNYQTD